MLLRELCVCVAMLLCLFVCLFTQGVALVLGTCSQYCCVCLFKQDVLVLRCLVQCCCVCLFKQCVVLGFDLFSRLL
jgi:hypothetical protein